MFAKCSFVPKKNRVKNVAVYIKLPRPSIDSWHLETVVPRSGIRSLALGSRTDSMAMGFPFFPTSTISAPIVEIKSAPVHLTPGRGCPRSPCAVVPHLVRLLHRTLSLSGPRNLGRSLWAGRHFPHVFLVFFSFSRAFSCLIISSAFSESQMTRYWLGRTLTRDQLYKPRDAKLDDVATLAPTTGLTERRRGWNSAALRRKIPAQEWRFLLFEFVHWFPLWNQNDTNSSTKLIIFPYFCKQKEWIKINIYLMWIKIIVLKFFQAVHRIHETKSFYYVYGITRIL